MHYASVCCIGAIVDIPERHKVRQNDDTQEEGMTERARKWCEGFYKTCVDVLTTFLNRIRSLQKQTDN